METVHERNEVQSVEFTWKKWMVARKILFKSHITMIWTFIDHFFDQKLFFEMSLIYRTIVQYCKIIKTFYRLKQGEKNNFSKIFLHFYNAFDPYNGNMLWPIWIFLFGRTVLWLRTPYSTYFLLLAKQQTCSFKNLEV